MDYLRRYATGLDVDIRTRARVTAVDADGRGGLAVHTADGRVFSTAGVVAASGAFANPYRPELPGQDGFAGRVLHVADYRNPEAYVGQRVVVVGAGNSAVQVAYELAEEASVTLATRHPVAFVPQVIDGRDQHYWLTTSGFDRLPPHWLAHIVPGKLVLDTGDYRAALDDGRMDQRRMFTALHGDRVSWADSTTEQMDTVLLATGYRPSLDYLQPLGALDAAGLPLHVGGISSTHPGLVYLGLEFQRSFSSNTLRGVHRDAEHVIPPLVAYITGAARERSAAPPRNPVGIRMDSHSR